MALNGIMSQEDFAPVLLAMKTMRDGQREQKQAANKFLQEFQKSPEAWKVTIGILQSQADAEVKLFAATTLRGKITYDIQQIPAEALPSLRNQLLELLKTSATGPRPIRIQLCVCLANLAIQMTAWKDVVQMVVTTLGNDADSHACILDFLKVLPEEVTEGRRMNLAEEELSQRTQELLTDNAGSVVQLLVSYAQSSDSAATNPQLLEVITSWLREVPVADVVNSPLLGLVFKALDSDRSFEAATDCLCAIFRETRDVDDNLATIQVLLPQVIAQRPRIGQAAEQEDTEVLKGITRVFAEAGEAWVILIAREATTLRPLVEAILECAARDVDRDTIGLTFNFWYELKLYLIMERYIQSRVQYVDVYSSLVDIIMNKLEYPSSETSNDLDLFDGDKEAEEKFREFRHHMGDVLKDSCEIMGATPCLTKVLDRIKLWMTSYATQATEKSVPHWQQLEAPIFSIRAIGKSVDQDEDIILPQIIPLLVQIPSHAKLRYATILALGRYTEWTSKHPEYLGQQFTYIASSFGDQSQDILQAAALAMKYFCEDCKHQLGGQILEMQSFYDQNLDRLDQKSKEELTEGVSIVLGEQRPDQIYKLLKLYVDPLMARLMAMANSAANETGHEGKLAIADHLGLISIFIKFVQPYVEPGQENPAVKYCQEIFPFLSKILDTFINSVPVCERICKMWRYMIVSYRTAALPLLDGPQGMANKLATGFEGSKQGCFLWATCPILREFSEDREHVDEQTIAAIYAFFEQQARTTLRIMSSLPPADVPDVIEDFYRLVIDALLYFTQKLAESELFAPIFEAAVAALALEQYGPLSMTLHYIRDVIAYAGNNPPQSSDTPNAPTIQHAVQQLLLASGERLVSNIMVGMMITFPDDVFADGSGALLGLFEILPQETTTWVDKTVRLLPAGTVSEVQIDKLLANIRVCLASRDDSKRVRRLLQDFTNSYRRRNIAPRDGLGDLAATRFRWGG